MLEVINHCMLLYCTDLTSHRSLETRANRETNSFAVRLGVFEDVAQSTMGEGASYLKRFQRRSLLVCGLETILVIFW